MASANGSVIQGSFLHGLPRPALHGPAVRGVAPPGPRPPIQRMANGSAVQVPVSPGFFGTGMGQRLPETIQRKMESLFGTRFDDVRIHVGPQATSLGALAFTYGSSIYFAHGQYNPQTAQGQRLLGHELTHVVQQRSGRARNPFGSGVAVLQDPAMEAEAERMGLRAAAPEMGRMPAAPPAVQRKPVMGAPPRSVLQARILPVQQPGRRGVLQMVREEELQALSMLFKAYEWSRKNKVNAGEIQAMYIDSNVVVASNFQGELNSVQELLRKKSGKEIENLGKKMHTDALVVDGKKRFAASYDFLFGTFHSNSVQGEERAIAASQFVDTHFRNKQDNLLKGIEKVASASSASACAGLLSSSNTIIFLKSDDQHHAEQQLLEVLACLLQNGQVPTDLGIRGVRKPCSACHKAMKSFAAACHEVYNRTLDHLGEGEGTNAQILNLKQKFSGASGDFGRFIEIYDELRTPQSYKFEVNDRVTAGKVAKILKEHLSANGYGQAKLQLLAGYNQNFPGAISIRRRNNEASPVVFEKQAGKEKDEGLSELLTVLQIDHEAPPKIETVSAPKVVSKPSSSKKEQEANVKTKNTKVNLNRANVNPNQNANQGQGSSWGMGGWLAAGAVTTLGIAAACTYGPTLVSYASSLFMKEDPARKQPSLSVPPGRRNRPLPP